MSCRLPKLVLLGASASDGGHKRCMLGVWSKAFTSQGETRIWAFPPSNKELCLKCLWYLCIRFFYLFQCGYFLSSLLYRSLLTSFWFSLGVV